MKFNKTVLLISLIICMFAMASVCASDANDTAMASEDTGEIGLSANDAITDDFKANGDNTPLKQMDSDVISSVGNDLDVLSNNLGTYSQLMEEIGSGGNITLQHDYYTYDSGDTIYIYGDGRIIDGNGATIDMTGSNIRTFNIMGSGVTIKNLTIKNVKYASAIYFKAIGTVTNCNFVNNTAYDGGAIFFVSSGNVSYCNFVKNAVDDWGGAIFSYGGGSVSNCNFVNNTAGDNGGAIFFYADSIGVVTNCNFVNNTADYSGAIYFGAIGTVTNCNFVNNTAYSYGAIYFVSSGNVSYCNFTNNKATGNPGNGGAVYFSGSGTVENCNFADNSANRGGAIFSQQEYTTADTCIFKTDSDTNVNTVIYPPTLNVDNFTTSYGSGEKLTFDLKTYSNRTVNNGNISIRVYYKNNDSWVGNYSCLSGEGWTVDLPVGSYYAIFDTEYAQFKPVNRTITVTGGANPSKPDTNPSQTTTTQTTTTKNGNTIKLTLKKVKIKKSAKKLVLKATLKINGKKVKGKVVKFKFNGKTYKAKTNKKGVAKVTIKKKVLKKLKVGKKVKYSATYGGKTVKKTVKVKK